MLLIKRKETFNVTALQGSPFLSGAAKFDGMKDMPNVMSKFLAMGIPLQEVILRSTWNPANVINRKEFGSLSVGSEADVAVFTLRNGDFGFLDVT